MIKWPNREFFGAVFNRNFIEEYLLIVLRTGIYIFFFSTWLGYYLFKDIYMMNSLVEHQVIPLIPVSKLLPMWNS